MVKFTCSLCEGDYIPEVSGDADERMCNKCINVDKWVDFLRGEQEYSVTVTASFGVMAESHYHIKPITYHEWARSDSYGIFTGIYCHDCYDSNDTNKYPYRKDNYHDPAYTGERLDND